jgi:hypothetical protein
MIALLAPLTLLFWGFYVSLGGQPVLGGALKEQWGVGDQWNGKLP